MSVCLEDAGGTQASEVTAFKLHCKATPRGGKIKMPARVAVAALNRAHCPVKHRRAIEVKRI